MLAWYYKAIYPFRFVLKYNPKLILQMRFFKKFHRLIDFENPKTIDEKICWLSLNTDTSLWTDLTDKWKVREFVANRCGSNVLNELYGVWDNVNEIDFEALPNQFVLKTNNGCATNIIVRDKSKLNIAKTRKQLDEWMKYPYGIMVGEPHYTRIVPKIIAEKLLIQDGDVNQSLVDYKFFCIDGEPIYCNLIGDRVQNSHEYKQNIYDMDWNAHPDFFKCGETIKNVNRPESLSEMIKHVTRLAKGFKVVRVDFYDIDGKPIFGEMTFTPGPDVYFTEKYLRDMGDRIILCK